MNLSKTTLVAILLLVLGLGCAIGYFFTPSDPSENIIVESIDLDQAHNYSVNYRMAAGYCDSAVSKTSSYIVMNYQTSLEIVTGMNQIMAIASNNHKEQPENYRLYFTLNDAGAQTSNFVIVGCYGDNKTEYVSAENGEMPIMYSSGYLPCPQSCRFDESQPNVLMGNTGSSCQ